MKCGEVMNIDLIAFTIAKNTMTDIATRQKSYKDNITDEFILPLLNVDSNNQPIATIKENDVVICFNFRSDRCRQIVNALTQIDIPQYRINSLNIDLYTMTNYDETLKDVKVLYEKQNLKNTLGEVISQNGLTQLRIAETEKYPHVTFFFSGGREKKFQNEYRRLIESPKVATYDLQPEMSAEKVTNTYIKEIQTTKPYFICLNYANPDMVGHTGNYKAVTKAIEKVDSCLKKIVEKSLVEDYNNLSQKMDEFRSQEKIERKKQTEFSEKIDELNQETDTLLDELDKWQT